MNIIGVDPGSDGALAVIYEGRKSVRVFRFRDKSEQEIYDQFLIETMAPCRAYLEKVHAMPGQGVTSMFTFGKNYGFLRGVMISLHIPFIDTPPQAWQKGIGIGGKYESQPARKRAHLGLAQQLHPAIKTTLASADALLIAEYGYRMERGEG